MQTFGEQLLGVLNDILRSIVTWTPKILVGIALVLLALGVAKVVEWIVRSLLVRLRFGALVERVGVDRALHKIGVRQSVNSLIPRVVYFLLLFLFAKTAADALGLTAISDAIGAFMAYLPNLIAALLILIVGSAAAQLAGRAVTAAARNSGIAFAVSLGRLTSGVLLYVLGVMALAQLQIDIEIIRLFTMALLGGLALAFGLSFGLGSREITRNIIAGFYARKIFRIGKELEVAGEKGRLTSITPTQVLLEQGDRLVAISNSTFLEQVVKQ